jgi:antitoxin HicB
MDEFYPIVVVQATKEDGGGFLGFAPDLKGCISHGDTQEEAFTGAREAIEEWLLEAKELGREIPKPHSASETAKEQRSALMVQIKEQSVAIESMSDDIKKLKEDNEKLRSVLANVGNHASDYVVWGPISRRLHPVSHKGFDEDIFH